MRIHNDSAQTATPAAAGPSDSATFLWLMILTLAGVGGSLVISCVAPFVALAVGLAGTVRLRLALVAMSIIWFANQVIGFTVFNFPRTANTILWGFAIGAAALFSTSVASLAINRLRPVRVFGRLGFAFGLAFVNFQAILMLAALFLGGEETFAPAVIAQVALANAAWFAGLIALNEVMSILNKWLVRPMPRLLKVQ